MEDSEIITIHIDPEIKELIPGFIENRRGDLGVLANALGVNDYGTIWTVGHGMKGAGAGYGFAGITEIGAFIEQGAKVRDCAQVRLGIKRLEHYLDHVSIVYE